MFSTTPKMSLVPQPCYLMFNKSSFTGKSTGEHSRPLLTSRCWLNEEDMELCYHSFISHYGVHKTMSRSYSYPDSTVLIQDISDQHRKSSFRLSTMCHISLNIPVHSAVSTNSCTYYNKLHYFSYSGCGSVLIVKLGA
jgi:hypothetical protein